MSNEKVSIIVPVYNVEDYLSRCMDSILRQTYTNIEIIVVDDGATDKSGELCDKYAQKDSRVRVVHQENRGLSGARNTGIDTATGEYITFIDSDDYVADNYVEELLLILHQHKADISICMGKKFSDVVGNLEKGEDKIFLYTSETALESMLYRKKVNSYAWGKMYKRKLFEEVRFPVGELFEDVKTIYKVYDIANIIALTEQQLYFYYQRTGSIVNSEFNIKKMDQVWAAKEILEFVKKKYPNLINAAVSKYFISAIDIYRRIPLQSENKEEKKILERIIKKYRYNVVKNKNNKKLTRIIGGIAIINVKILNYLGKFYQWLIEKNIIAPKNPI